MTPAHLHLILNHFPTVGTIIALALFFLSFVRRNEMLQRVSLEVFYLIALVTLPVYLSGVATQLAIEGRPGVSKALMDTHHDAAVWGLMLMTVTGGAAWLALWQYRRLGRSSRWSLTAVALMSIVTVAVMARTATLGGEVRHPEILFDESGREAAEAAVPELPGIAASIAAFATENTWAWPAAEALHFIGLWLLFGVVALVNLRMLGLMKAASFASLHRLLPWAVLALGVNILTGMLFVIAAPGQYMENLSFYWKIGLLLLAGANLLYLTVFDEPWEVRAGDDVPFTAKAIAASALASWVGVMYFGRMLPFIGNAF